MHLANGIEPPRSRIVINQNHTAKHLNNISMSHPFNFQLNLLTNNDNQSSATLHKILQQQHTHWYSCKSSALFLLQLVERLSTTGDHDGRHVVYIHSLHGTSESSNMIAIYPKFAKDQTDENAVVHTLLLRVDKDTYEQLGLDGSLIDTHTHHNYHDRLYKSFYKVVVELPIKSQKVSERVKWALQRLTNVHTLCSVYLRDNSGAFSSVDLESTFDLLNKENQLGCQYKMVKGYGSEIVTSNHNLPIFERETNENRELVFEALNTMGALLTQVQLTTETASALNLALATENQRNVLLTTVTGFIPSHVITQVVLALKERKIDETQNWECILVRGMEDSLISWRDSSHEFGMSGENDYAILFTNNNQLISCQILGQLDQF